MGEDWGEGEKSSLPFKGRVGVGMGLAPVQKHPLPLLTSP